MKEVDWEGLLGSHHEALPDMAVLGGDSEQRLHAMAQATLQREQAALSTALEESLSFVPRLLRGAVKKLVMR